MKKCSLTKSVHFSGSFSHPPAEGEPAQKVPVFSDNPATSANRELAQNPALCGQKTDRILRAELRRKNRDARAAGGDRLLPLDLLGGLQRVGGQERLDAQPAQLREHR